MPDNLEHIPAELVFRNNPPPDTYCYPSTIIGLMRLIKDFFVIRLVAKQQFRFVIVSSQTPDQEGIGYPWLEVDSSGNVNGFKYFVKGDWRQIYVLPPYHVCYLYGDPANPPDGWRYLDGTVSGYENLSSLVKTLASGKKVYPAAFVGYTSGS